MLDTLLELNEMANFKDHPHQPPQLQQDDDDDGPFVFLSSSQPQGGGSGTSERRRRRPHRTPAVEEDEEEKKMEDGLITSTYYNKTRIKTPTTSSTNESMSSLGLSTICSTACDSSTTTTTHRRHPRIKRSFHRQQHWRYCGWIRERSSSSWGAWLILIVLILLLGLWFVTNSLVFVAMQHNPPSPTQQQQHQQQPLLSNLNQQDLWSNPKYNVVHVIQTRFMQMQPHLIHLGQARLQLFASVTVPSILHQTEQSFLWIVRTDPDLDPSIREPLIQLLQPIPNVLLVASNDNPEGFREAHCIADIHPDTTVWSGHYALLQSYHDAAMTHTVLESRLDADDAVAVDFVELVQTNAAATTTTPTTATPVWRVWCAENHVEWQYDSPWTNTTTTATTSTATTTTTTTTATTSRGALLGLHAGKCITPGLTWQYGVGVHRSQIPLSSKHHQIQKLVRPCPEEDEDNHKYDDNQCLSKLGGDLPLALRARTPTSAGMDHIIVMANNRTDHGVSLQQQLQHSQWKETQDALWESLPLLFGIQALDLWNVRAYIHDHLVDIARDALQGQCTKGHSCKEQSQVVLQELVRNGA